MSLLLKIGLDTGCEGGSIAWALDYPGCFSTGKDGSEAILNMPRAFLQYCDWTTKHSPVSWLAQLGDFDLRLVETVECYSITQDFDRVETHPDQTIGAGHLASPPHPGPSTVVETQYLASPPLYEVGSWFLHDWKPLTPEDVRRGLLLLEWSRADLLGILSGLAPEQRAKNHPGERWSIDGILNHVGGAEWWYMHNLGLAGLERAELSDVPDERLAQVRTRLRQLLPALVEVRQVVGQDGELWSPRKLLRRALWHERDHTGHILKLI